MLVGRHVEKFKVFLATSNKTKIYSTQNNNQNVPKPSSKTPKMIWENLEE